VQSVLIAVPENIVGDALAAFGVSSVNAVAMPTILAQAAVMVDQAAIDFRADRVLPQADALFVIMDDAVDEFAVSAVARVETTFGFLAGVGEVALGRDLQPQNQVSWQRTNMQPSIVTRSPTRRELQWALPVLSSPAALARRV